MMHSGLIEFIQRSEEGFACSCNDPVVGSILANGHRNYEDRNSSGQLYL